MTQKIDKSAGSSALKGGANELSRWLGCSTRTIGSYRASGLITPDARGQYLLQASCAAIANHLRDIAMGRTTITDDGDEKVDPVLENALLSRARRHLTTLQQTKERAKIAHAEAELALIQGRTIDVESALEAWGLILTTAKGRLRAIPSSMAHTLGLTRKGISDLTDAIDLVLTNLAEDGESTHAAVAKKQAAAQRAARTTTTMKDFDA